MHFRFANASTLLRSDAELLVLPLFESDLTGRASSAPLKSVDKALNGHLLKAAAQEGFTGKVDQTLTFHTHGKIGAERVMLVGLGSRAKFNPEYLRLAAGRAAKLSLRLKASAVAIAMADLPKPDDCFKAVSEGFVLGAYRFDRYRTKGDERPNGKAPAEVRMLVAENGAQAKARQELVDLGQRIGEATNWARNLVNEPAGVMTPKQLAHEAREAARKHGLKITVRGLDEIKKLRLGMFLGVTQGSAEEPQLVQVSYIPKSAKDAKKPPVVLVGKAITFDSGGLSLKSADGMVDMKTDMAGSAAVLATMQVVGDLKPPFPVHALLGACENMPSGTAYRPGDILVSRLGKTVEITNTDAEGRLVLGDMLTLASELKPAAIVDVATLTSACMVALGHYVMGAFGSDDALMSSVLESGKAAGEALWQLPIHELQKDALKSDVADMKNSGERFGGAINAAHFLSEFVGDAPWVHLDIAGPSTSSKERGYVSKGATGAGVRTLVELIRRRASEA